jgi:hypothetical protein
LDDKRNERRLAFVVKKTENPMEINLALANHLKPRRNKNKNIGELSVTCASV